MNGIRLNETQIDETRLPGELAELEAALSRCPKLEAPGLLRSQVMAGVAVALRRQQAERRWTFAALVAATVFLWINLSWALSRETIFGWEFRRDRVAAADLADQLQVAVPGLSPVEARRLAIIWR